MADYVHIYSGEISSGPNAGKKTGEYCQELAFWPGVCGLPYGASEEQCKAACIEQAHIRKAANPKLSIKVVEKVWDENMTHVVRGKRRKGGFKKTILLEL